MTNNLLLSYWVKLSYEWIRQYIVRVITPLNVSGIVDEILGRQTGKEQGRVYRDTPGRDRDNSQRNRDRDYRENSRRQNRDGQKMREKSDDNNKEQTSGSSPSTWYFT